MAIGKSRVISNIHVKLIIDLCPDTLENATLLVDFLRLERLRQPSCFAFPGQREIKKPCYDTSFAVHLVTTTTKICEDNK